MRARAGISPREASRLRRGAYDGSTTNEVFGHRTVRHLGVCRGGTVRSRSVVGNWFGGVQAVFGGRLSGFAKLAENPRQEACDLMVHDAQQAGGNAVVGIRYDANGISDGITEVLAYGPAVLVEAGGDLRCSGPAPAGHLQRSL